MTEHEWAIDERTSPDLDAISARWAAEDVHMLVVEVRRLREELAAARNALPDLLAAAEAVERVKALHQPKRIYLINGLGEGCAGCHTFTYPCPTIRALEGATDAE